MTVYRGDDGVRLYWVFPDDTAVPVDEMSDDDWRETDVTKSLAVERKPGAQAQRDMTYFAAHGHEEPHFDGDGMCACQCADCVTGEMCLCFCLDCACEKPEDHAAFAD